MSEKQKKRQWHTPTERIMMTGFGVVIILGTLLLCLPVSSASGKGVYWLDALFTATTSVCVTGLVTVPTATTWSVFGKIVILGLIQFGGLGIMACMIMIFLVFRRKISLQSRKLIQDTYNLPVLKGSVGIVRRLLIGTAVVEIAGAICYGFWFVPHYGLWRGIGYSIFHSISAFCNAGIDLVGESSFAPFVTNPLMNVTTMGLIILSGLGFPVWWEVIEHVQDRKGHDMRYAIDPTKIHNELGWLPETMFKDGIRLTIQWYLDHKEWWENIVNGEYQNYYKEMYGKKGL